MHESAFLHQRMAFYRESQAGKDPLTLTLALSPFQGGRCEKIGSVLFHVIPAKAGIQCFQGISN